MRLVRPGKTMQGATMAIAVGMALAVLAVIAWAWVDGGREPLHPIEVPIAVPESAR